MNRKGRASFTAYSAGSHPAGFVHPEALKQIAAAGLSTDGFSSKSWNQFAKPDAPHGLRQRCQRSMPGLAGAAYDGRPILLPL